MKTRIRPVDKASKGKEAIQAGRLIKFLGVETFGFVVSSHPPVWC
jgi:hypothetical protein